MSGNASFRVEEKNYNHVGKATLIKEAKLLEDEKLIKIRWVKGYYNEDIEKVEYPLKHIMEFYGKINRIPKYQIMDQKLGMVLSYYEKFKSVWIRKYAEEEVFDTALRF